MKDHVVVDGSFVFRRQDFYLLTLQRLDKREITDKEKAEHPLPKAPLYMSLFLTQPQPLVPAQAMPKISRFDFEQPGGESDTVLLYLEILQDVTECHDEELPTLGRLCSDMHVEVKK